MGAHRHTCTQSPQRERKKEKDQSRAPGLSLEALQPGDTAAGPAAAAVVSLLPSPLSPNNHRSEAALFCLLTAFVWENTISSPSLSNLQGSCLIPLSGMNSGSSLHFMMGCRHPRGGGFPASTGNAGRAGWVSLDSIFRHVVLNSWSGPALSLGNLKKKKKKKYMWTVLISAQGTICKQFIQ